MEKKDNADSESSIEGGENSQLINNIRGTHAPDLEDFDVDIKPLLHIVVDIMTRANPLSARITNLDDLVKSNVKADSHITEVLESPIHYTSYVMTWKCVGGVNAHDVTMDLLGSLSNYSWDAKAVITCAAFAINYGEFSLLTQSSDKTIATLMEVSQQSFQSSDHTEAVLNLLADTIKLTRCLVEFNSIPPKYLNLQPNDIPLVVYLIIKTLVVCASLLTDKITNEGKKSLSTLQRRISSKLKKWQDKVTNFKKLEEFERRYIEFGDTIGKPSPQRDNMKVLSAFFCPREDQRPLYNCSRKTNEMLEVLRNKYVLLLITDLEFHQEDKIHLEHIYSRKTDSFEILWLPIVDPGTAMNEKRQEMFGVLRDSFPWFSAEHPSAIEQVAIKFIRGDLNFRGLPLVAVLDPEGRLVNNDALPMMYIWELDAFPFTLEREKLLWAESTWNTDLFADHVDPRLPEWISAKKVVCLYGGDNIGLIRNFTNAARKAAEELHVPLEMLYVGKHRPKEEVNKCRDVITEEKLSHILDPSEYWYFWMRFTSMWNSKKKLGRTVEDDDIMKKILDLLTYDMSEEWGWAVFGWGNDEMIMSLVDKLLPTLEGHASWANEVDQPDKFVHMLGRILPSYKPQSHCNRLILPGYSEYIPDRVACGECGKLMEKYVMYRCCEDE